MTRDLRLAMDRTVHDLGKQMSAAVPNDAGQVDGALDLARLAGNPMFHFDLGPVLAPCQRNSAPHLERLRLMCEQHVARLVPRDIVLFAGAGFYLRHAD